MEYKIVLEVFEGPLDLLLHLIQKAQIDIYDIPINLITEQFIDYIHGMEELNLQVTSDFLLMAATLLEIKSKTLLPEDKDSNEEFEEDYDPREELILQLLEYKKYKDASEKLKTYESMEYGAYYKPREEIPLLGDEQLEIKGLDIEKLLISINRLITRRGRIDSNLDINEIQREEYTLEECIGDILVQLRVKPTLKFTELLKENSTRSEIIAYFLSLLELARMKNIYIVQDDNFTDLIIMNREDEEI